MKDCSDCTYMGIYEDKDGKFECTNSKSRYKVVSARMPQCPCFLEAFQSRRGEGERKRYRDISRSHGYHIMSAVTEILQLPENNVYLYGFMELRDCEMSNNLNKYGDFLDYYDNYGPAIADLIRNDDERYHICGEVLNALTNFPNSVAKSEYDVAFSLYFNMFNMLIKHYGLQEPKLALC